MRDYSLEDMEEENKEFYSKETKTIRERENMPEISAAAHKTLNNYPGHTKQHINQKQNKVIIETCKTCNKQYDQEKEHQILATLPTITGFDYDNQCLNCIKETSQNIKASYHPDLKEAKEALAKLTITYQKAHNYHRTLAAKYQKYDYQENMINHHLQQAVANKQTTKTKKKQTSDQIKQATAMKILDNLTKEQRASILAMMTKQS